MSPAVAIVHGCPRCKGDVAYVVDRQAYCCQAEGCDYSRPTLAPDPKELVVKLTGQEAPTQPATKETFTLDELMKRWNLSEAGVRMRLVKYAKRESVSRSVPIPLADVEVVEKHVASWEDNPPRTGPKPPVEARPSEVERIPEPVAALRSAPEVERGAPSGPPWSKDTAPVDANARRAARLHLSLERIAQASEHESGLIYALAKLALDLDALEG